jgi:hypothetical protein
MYFAMAVRSGRGVVVGIFDITFITFITLRTVVAVVSVVASMPVI